MRLGLYHLFCAIIDCIESDLVSSRTLERRVDVDGGMTVGSCVSACQSQSFTITGLEYAQECCKSTNLHLRWTAGAD